jgi:hypothetical protein
VLLAAFELILLAGWWFIRRQHDWTPYMKRVSYGRLVISAILINVYGLNAVFPAASFWLACQILCSPAGVPGP